MKRSFETRLRETLFGLSVFGLFAIMLACGGGGGGGGGGTNTTTTATTATTSTDTTTTTGSTNGSLYPDQIFYSVFDGDGDSIFRIDPDGTDNTLFVDLPADVPNAAQNEAGDRFAFFVETDVDPGAGVDLRYNLWTNTTVSTGTGALRLTPENDPNGYRDFIFVGTVQFTPDGSKIVFTAALSEAEFGIYTVDTVGGSLVRIGDGEEAQLNLAGNKLVLTRVANGAGEIYSMNLNGSGLARLTSNSFEDFMPQWSKDGTQVIFSTDRNEGQFDIYRMTSTGSGQTRLTDTIDDEYGPSLNNDGTQFAYTLISGDPDFYGVYRKPVAGGGINAVFLDPAIGQQVYWTPIPASGRLRQGFGTVQLGKPHRPRFERTDRKDR